MSPKEVSVKSVSAIVLALSSLCLAQGSTSTDSILRFKGFDVEIAGVADQVTSFSGGGVTFNKNETTGGDRPDSRREYRVGKVNWANIVIEKNAVQGDSRWKDWFEKQGKGRPEFFSVSVVFHAGTGVEVLRANYVDCFPVDYATVLSIGPDGCGAEQERLTLAVGSGEYHADYVPEGIDRTGGHIGTSESTRSTVTAYPWAGNWWSFSGGGESVEIVTYTAGPDQHEQKRPGQIDSSDITIKGPFVKDRKAIMDWVNETAAGKDKRVDMTLAFQNDKGDDLSAYSLLQSVPISYQPPAVSAGNYDMLEESLTFHVEEVRKAR